jgi:hypothetical protein
MGCRVREAHFSPVIYRRVLIGLVIYGLYDAYART